MDHSIVVFLNQWAGSSVFSEQLMVFFAEQFPYVLFLIFVFFIVRESPVFYTRFILLAEGLIAGVLARVGVELIRFYVHRLRPLVEDSAIQGLLVEQSYSFPSGHAGFFFALATVVYARDRGWGLWVFVGAVLNGLARIASGVHYPSDIIGGALLGILVGGGVALALRKYVKTDAIPPSVTHPIR